MTRFSIDEDNNITALKGGEPPSGESGFSSQAELAALAKQWPASRLVDLWNSIPGLTPVRKFTDRGTALKRLWKALQSLDSAAEPAARRTVPQAGRKGKAARKAPAAKQTTKKAQVIALLGRPHGARLEEIMSVTSWQAHTVRGFISRALIRNAGLAVESFRTAKGQRAYRIGR